MQGSKKYRHQIGRSLDRAREGVTVPCDAVILLQSERNGSTVIVRYRAGDCRDWNEFVARRHFLLPATLFYVGNDQA
jgi:hypothetical protein